MAQLLLETGSLRLLLFGGKGGTGKTTSAAAGATYLARLFPQKKILLISTDPAHSLADSLGAAGGHGPILVTGFANLRFRELDAEQVARQYRAEHENATRKLLDRGTYLDDRDIDEFRRLPSPGLDEVMAVTEIANLLKTGRYDLIVIDTAPTGHTLRLLSMPDEMERWVHVFGLMQRKHRFMMRRFTGRYVKDDADHFLVTTAADVRRLRDLLKDHDATEFVPVTIPEPLSIRETERLVAALGTHGIAVNNLIVNRVPPEGGCPFCRSREEKAAPWLEEIHQKFASWNIVQVPLSPGEIRGVDALAEFAKSLFGDGTKRPVAKPERASWLKGFLGRKSKSVHAASDLLHRPGKFILFGGKGGVGKTSLAAATAVRLAALDPSNRILVFSTDPAHSLGDSLAATVGDKITRIDTEGRLDALEIDSERHLEQFREEYRESIEAVFSRFVGGGVDVKFDREVMSELITLSPPGLDELVALIEVMDLSDEYDHLILDTAPTGHLIRFLEMPDLARGWVRALLKILLKYKTVMGLAETAQKLVNLSRDIRRIKDVLTDAERCEFVAVTIPEAMALAETRRLLARLGELGTPCRHVVVNMVVPPTQCSFCRMVRQHQTEYLAQAGELSPNAVAEVPLFPHQISGTEHLRKLADAVYGRKSSLLALVAGVL